MNAEIYDDLGFAKVDLSRESRQGYPEVIYGCGKTNEQICGICGSLLSNGGEHILVTRIGKGCACDLEHRFGEVSYSEAASVAIVNPRKLHPQGSVIVATAGTSDICVAEEAAITAEAMDADVMRIYDVGVSGIHRILAYKDALSTANAIVVAAGMDGALPSVVGGLTDRPVIALPTSVGYGASFNGLAALLSMLNSCSAGVTVVNIDNGFGAGFAAGRINRLIVGGGKV